MSKETGGSAFPGPAQTQCAQDINEGMTLRDYFAAKAITPWIEGFEQCLMDDEDFARVARNCYRLADAMLEARK